MSKNTALVFVKPHANNEAVNTLVTDKLKESNFTVLNSGSVDGPKIDSDRIIDQHYATISRYAIDASADQLPVPADTKEKFNEKFGKNWDELVAAGSILNAKAASEKLGGISAADLTTKWKASVTFKLAPGLYVANFEADSIFVINGFFLLNREKFTKEDVKVNWYVVEWDESAMTWADFRGKFIGPTNPEAAPEGSLRGIIMKDWSSLGLAEQPNVSDNGVHASAGPIEGLNERAIWTGANIEEDTYGKQLAAAGCDMNLVKEWLGNPVVELNGSKAPAYDHLEDKQSSEVVELIKGASSGSSSSAPAPAPAAEEKTEETAPATNATAKRVFTEEEKKKLELIFELFDEDKSGTIDSKELPNVVRYVGYTPSETQCQDLMKRYDENNDGKISLAEFYTLCETEDIPADSDDDLRAAFEEFDVNKDGFLSKKELVDALTTFGEPMTESEIESMFKGIDVNGDGKISIAEFVSAMRAPKI